MARYAVPDGWVAQAYRFALDPTPTQGRALASHAGAARCAFNHMLDVVKKNLDQRAAERTYGLADAELTATQGWSLPALRKTWNRHKRHMAPWWAVNSKEAYNTGLDALARALEAWNKSRTGHRGGRTVGFPRFKSRARSRPTVRFSTGTIRVEPDRHHVTLPTLGTIKTHESTRKLARRLQVGSARVLSATVTQDAAGRWYCAFAVIVQRARRRAARPAASRHPVVGADVGVKDLLVAATPEGTEVARVPAPKPLGKARARLRRLQRRAARQRGPYDTAAHARRAPSKRWRRTQARIGKIHVRVTNVRRDVLHKATTALARQHDTIVVETLNAAGMRTAGGARKKGLNRALADAALAEIRRMLAYKTRWYSSTLAEADRWYPSSKTCSACGGRKPSLTLTERDYQCHTCGAVTDRDLNAAINLARLGDTHQAVEETGPAGSGSVAGRGATQETASAQAGNAAGDEASTPHSTPGAGQTGTAPPQGEAA